MIWWVTHLIDVVSNNHDDYTRYSRVEADDDISAVKKFVASQVLEPYRKEYDDLIDSMKQDVSEIVSQLVNYRIVIINIQKQEQ